MHVYLLSYCAKPFISLLQNKQVYTTLAQYLPAWSPWGSSSLASSSSVANRWISEVAKKRIFDTFKYKQLFSLFYATSALLPLNKANRKALCTLHCLKSDFISTFYPC